VKAQEGEEAAEAESEASRDWDMRLQGRSRLHNIEVQGKAAGADVEVAVGYPEDLAEVRTGLH